MNVNRGLAQELGLTSLAVSEAIFFCFLFFVIKRIGMRYRHMEKYGLGHWTLGLFFGPFFFYHFIEGGPPLGLREEWDAVHQYLGRGER